MSARVLLAAPVLVVALAACGGGGGSGNAAAASHPQTLSGLLSALGCKAGTTTVGEATIYASDGGSCTTASGDVTVTMFATSANRDRWLAIAKTMGGGYVVGDRWVVATDTAPAARAVQPTVGGKVQ